MKRILALSLVMLLAFSSFACGQSTQQTETAQDAASSSDTAAPAEAQTAEETTTAETTQETETYDPDEPIVFNDDALEDGVRSALNKPEGDILVSDAQSLTELNLEMDGSDWSIPRIQNLDALKYFTNLTWLNLNWGLTAGEQGLDLSPLSGLTNLTDLQLCCTEATDLSPLGSLIHLQFLSIWGCRGITDISFVANLKELYNLQANGNYISDISALSGLSELQYLTLNGNVIQDVSPLAGLTNLKMLMLSDNLIEDYSPLSDLYANLEETDFALDDVPQAIEFNDPVLEQKVRAALDIPDGNITFVQTKDVTNLQLGNEWQETIPEDIQITDISALKYFPNLYNLSLQFNGIYSIEVLRAMPNLGLLDLNGNPLQSIVPIENCKNLTWLNLSETHVENLYPLTYLTQLQSLLLNYVPTFDNIDAVASLTNLKELQLQGLWVDLTPVASLKNLTTLYIADEYSGDLSVLADIYPNLTDKNFDMP